MGTFSASDREYGPPGYAKQESLPIIKYVTYEKTKVLPKLQT